MSTKPSQLRQIVAALPRLIDGIDRELREVCSRMKVLEKNGLVYATEHWRDDRYLYLIYPMTGGDRRREYVGADSVKIAEARAGIERGREFDELAGRLKQIEGRLQRGAAAIQQAKRELG